MRNFFIGVVVGIALGTWGVDGTTRIVQNGITKIQDGARTVETHVNK